MAIRLTGVRDRLGRLIWWPGKELGAPSPLTENSTIYAADASALTPSISSPSVATRISVGSSGPTVLSYEPAHEATIYVSTGGARQSKGWSAGFVRAFGRRILNQIWFDPETKFVIRKRYGVAQIDAQALEASRSE